MNKPLEGARVLIVEDEFYLADDLARALRNAGAEPIGPVGSVAEAENLVERRLVDAAIVDLNLHGNIASDFVERLEARELPCIIVSGYSEEALPEDVSDVLSLQKPVDPDSVIKSLATELARVG